MGRLLLYGFAGLLLVAGFGMAQADGLSTGPRHGLSMFGDLKYGPDFGHFDYVNPNAPQGGEVKLAAIGSFDSLNPNVLKGIPAASLGLTTDTLLASSDDEAFAEYGLIAESVEIAPDRAAVTFTLRAIARWHDGSPITAEDVIFSLNVLKEKGHPTYRAYYADVLDAEKVGERKVRFRFRDGKNRELPLILGQMPIVSKAYYSKVDFEKTTLEPPLASGPYRIEAVDPGRSITYARVKDYWGNDLPVNRGKYNFERIRIDYYRDTVVAVEAFKAGEYDLRQENVSKNWATAYDFPALQQGYVQKVEIPHAIPTGMQCFVFNTRRPIFADRRVRQALTQVFDFEWTNKSLFYGAYTRTESYFSNSELASRGRPSPEELKLLEPFRGQIPEEVFTEEYAPPATDGSGDIRTNLRKAFRLLEEAGWVVRDHVLVNAETGAPFTFEIMLVDPSFERVVLPYVRNLKRLGIEVRVRTVDPSQYQNRFNDFDFDMTVAAFGQSLSPGNEQRDFWSSRAAETPGSRNLIGVRDPVVDSLIESLINAPDRASLITRTRALDRVLLWGHYVVPHWHIRHFRVIYWDRFGRPEHPPKYALGFNDWWIEPEKDAVLRRHRNQPAKP
ncbi:MAG: ABC transporter substrate-binding protein [Alphaproteobacteria bacterium]|nr:ABC transporter substrate-binding protein [Alphaproteobacteria bacterium]